MNHRPPERIREIRNGSVAAAQSSASRPARSMPRCWLPLSPPRQPVAHGRASSQKKTYERTTTFLRQGASAGAVGSMQAEWKDQRETEPSVTES